MSLQRLDRSAGDRGVGDASWAWIAATPAGQAGTKSTRRSKVETFTGSITDPANIDLGMRDCDAVINLAAVADVGQVHADPILAGEVNTRGR